MTNIVTVSKETLVSEQKTKDYLFEANHINKLDLGYTVLTFISTYTIFMFLVFGIRIAIILNVFLNCNL